MSDNECGDILKYGDILEQIKAKGYSEQNLLTCIKDYEKNGVWEMKDKRSKLRWLKTDK